MYLKHLHLLDFKNYETFDSAFIPGINCITGMNGKGKTNLLDAIHYLSFCKSFLNPIDTQNIRYDAPFFVIEGKFWRQGVEEVIYCGLKRGSKKQFKRNKKEYERLADHIGLFPLVLICPQDIQLLMGGSEERRKFLDSLICQFDRVYLDKLMRYNRQIQQRNAYLKKAWEERKLEEDVLEVLDLQLDELVSYISQTRHQFMVEFEPVFQQQYQHISGQAEQVSLVYSTTLQANEPTFLEQMKQAREKDRFMQYTTVGTHKDDLGFQLADYPIKKYGSQGQQKSFLTALKLAEHRFLSTKMGFSPILLLDDIFDKLDANRVKQLIQIVSHEGFGQVFITDTGPERIEPIFNQLQIPAQFMDV